MTTFLEILGALLLSFAIAFAIYGIISALVKYKQEKELEKYMKERESGFDYDDDDDDYD